MSGCHLTRKKNSGLLTCSRWFGRHLCAGRAIRHRADWASLVLIDARYSAPRIRNKLPNWIGQNIIVTETFGAAIKEMGRFYRDKRPEA